MEQIFGISGLTFGSAGWTLAIFALGAIVQKWVVGRADMKRAENEGVVAKHTAEEKVREQLFDQMIRTTDRLEAEVVSLRLRVADLEKIEREHLREINDNLREIAQLKGTQSG